MVVLEKVYVNPAFSTSPVQVVPRSFLYQWAGTPFGVLLRAYFASELQALNNQPEGAKVRYNAGRLSCNTKREAEGT